MARCKSDELLAKIGIKSLNNTMEVDFAVITDLSDCIKVNAKNYYETDNADNATFYLYRVPDDMFNCMPIGCRNGGTFVMSRSTYGSVAASYRLTYDATEIASGAVTFYVWLESTGVHTVSMTISDATDPNFTNYDRYISTVNSTGAGFYPVIMDFSQAPSAQGGSGWNPTEAGAVFKSIVVPPVGPPDTTPFTAGVSSFNFYRSIEEFEVNDVVKVACLTEIGGDITMDPADASCWGAGYASDSIAIEKTITGASVTPNYWKLNPLMDKGDKADGWFISSTTKTIQGPITVDGREYGFIQLPDMNMDECAFIGAAIADECNVTDSSLTRVSTALPVALNERQFIVQNGKTTALTDAGRLLFHPSRVGLKVVVSYPKASPVEHFVASDANVDARRTRMSYTVTQTDGVKTVYVFNNVLVTSFPATIGTEETTFSFTISIQRDKDGNFFERYRIMD